ncbi:MAG: polysaccharide biosynthesis/export family protein [Cyclobacteriaceae bacterium]
MFKLDEEFGADDLSQAVREAEKNYVIQINDYVQINVFTNNGERIIDPNNQFNNNQGNQQNLRNNQRQFEYLVQVDGRVKVPILGLVKLEGMTIQEAETYLEQLFDEYYKDSFVRLQYINKRVILLGATGGSVITLQNENISLVEIIAMAGGISQGAKSSTVKLIRGDLTNPEVFSVDLRTISGMKASILNVEPGDIIYVEPRRRVFFEAIRDVGPIMGLISSLLTLAFIIENVSNR